MFGEGELARPNCGYFIVVDIDNVGIDLTALEVILVKSNDEGEGERQRSRALLIIGRCMCQLSEHTDRR